MSFNLSDWEEIEEENIIWELKEKEIKDNINKFEIIDNKIIKINDEDYNIDDYSLNSKLLLDNSKNIKLINKSFKISKKNLSKNKKKSKSKSLVSLDDKKRFIQNYKEKEVKKNKKISLININ